MKTISEIREVLSKYFENSNIKVKVRIQKNRTLKYEDTVGEIVLDIDMAVAIFGHYEIMWNRMDTYHYCTEYDDAVLPCITCGVYVPLNDNGRVKTD